MSIASTEWRQMAAFWERLKKAREEAGLSLEELSERTRIRTPILSAIERGEFTRLSGGFYTRAFLRAYAAEVGLEPDPILREYAELFPEPTARPEPEASLTRPYRFAWPLRLRGVGAVAMVGLAAMLLWVTFTSNPADRARRAPQSSDPAATAMGTEISTLDTVANAEATSGFSRAADPPTSDITPAGIVLEVRPAGPLWLEVLADGERVIYRLLQQRENVTIRARDRVSVRLGDAAAFEYSINGEMGRPLGGPGAVRTINVTRANYRDYLRPVPDRQPSP